MLVLLGLAGCRQTENPGEFLGATDNQKVTARVDTALILGKWGYGSGAYGSTPRCNFLLINKDGEVVNLGMENPDAKDMSLFSNVGDTVLVDQQRIIKNITMEHKAKAFVRQR